MYKEQHCAAEYQRWRVPLLSEFPRSEHRCWTNISIRGRSVMTRVSSDNSLNCRAEMSPVVINQLKHHSSALKSQLFFLWHVMASSSFKIPIVQNQRSVHWLQIGCSIENNQHIFANITNITNICLADGSGRTLEAGFRIQDVGIVWHNRIVRIYKNGAQILIKTSKSLDVYSDYTQALVWAPCWGLRF